MRDDLIAEAAEREIAVYEKQVSTLSAELELERVRRNNAEADLAGMRRSLGSLCSCITHGPDIEGPARDCPIHGDGVAFAAEVQALRALAVAARAWAEPTNQDDDGQLTDGLLNALDALDGAR